ncbi:MAG: DUF935 family protein, partial [Planctomycetes bacterium]|nr:DUF935 family protein [Planctomycetota bacterium]
MPQVPKTNQPLPASFLSRFKTDPAATVPGAPVNFGRAAMPHIFSVAARVNILSKNYPWFDEALRDSRANAEAMRHETGIMECLEARQRGSALLKWHIEPDGKSADAKDLADRMTAIIQKTWNFLELRRNLLEALWYGRYMTTHRYSRKLIEGRYRQYISHWEPRHGDKLVFRYDDGSGEYYGDEVGIRVGGVWQIPNPEQVEVTAQFGRVYWLSGFEREMCAIHRHLIEDAEFHDTRGMGRIHGVGIRDRIYWCWYAMQECLANALDFIERNAHGIEIWRYPAGNPTAEQRTIEAAENRSNKAILLVPVQPGELQDLQSVEVVEPGFAGLDSLMSIIQDYFGHKIKRYILGQTLSSEAEATGLGSGVADAHLATLADIIRYDAIKLEETLTADLLLPLQRFNFPDSLHHNLLFRLDTEADDMEAKLAAFQMAWQMGARLPALDVMNLIGARIPDDDEEVLSQAALQQSQMPPGGPAEDAGNPPPGSDGGPWTPSAKKTFPPTGDAGGGAEGPPVDLARPGEPDKYEAEWDERKHPRDEGGKFTASGQDAKDAGNKRRDNHPDVIGSNEYLRRQFPQREIQDWIASEGSRNQIIEWLVWNDPNGVYTDTDSLAEGWEPLSEDGARSLMRSILNRDTGDAQFAGRASDVGKNAKGNRFASHAPSRKPLISQTAVDTISEAVSAGDDPDPHETAMSVLAPDTAAKPKKQTKQQRRQAALRKMRPEMRFAMSMVVQGKRVDKDLWQHLTPDEQSHIRTYRMHEGFKRAAIRGGIAAAIMLFGKVMQVQMEKAGAVSEGAGRLGKDTADQVNQLHKRLDDGEMAVLKMPLDKWNVYDPTGRNVDQVRKRAQETVHAYLATIFGRRNVRSMDIDANGNLTWGVRKVGDAIAEPETVPLPSARPALPGDGPRLIASQRHDVEATITRYGLRWAARKPTEPHSLPAGGSQSVLLPPRDPAGAVSSRYEAAAQWDESKHPRDESGKFTSGPGVPVGTAQAKTAPKQDTPAQNMTELSEYHADFLARTHGQWRFNTSPRDLQSELTRLGLIKGAKVERRGSSCLVNIPGKPPILVRIEQPGELRRMWRSSPETAEESSRIGGGSIPAGAYRNGEVVLAADFTGGEMSHELIHALQDLGVISDKEVQLFGGHEQMAYAYQRWYDSGRPKHGIFQRIFDFLSALVGNKTAQRQRMLERLDAGHQIAAARGSRNSAFWLKAALGATAANIAWDAIQPKLFPAHNRFLVDVPESAMSEDGGIPITRVQFATRDYQKWLDNFRNSDAMKAIYTQQEMDDLEKSIAANAVLLNALAAKDLLPEELKGNPLRVNSDKLFGHTLDFSTVCPHQDVYVDMLLELQRRTGQVFTKEQRFLIGR